MLVILKEDDWLLSKLIKVDLGLQLPLEGANRQSSIQPWFQLLHQRSLL